MSGRAPQRPPRDAIRIPARDRAEQATVARWLDANGFPFFVPEDSDLFLARDRRTVYGERFRIRRDDPAGSRRRSGFPSPRWDYVLTPDRDDARHEPFAYPIVRPLEDYAPEIAARLPRRPA